MTTRFATREPFADGELLEAEVRYPRPSVLAQPLDGHAKRLEGAGQARAGDRRRPARAPAARPPRGALAGRAGDRRAGHGRRRGPLDPLAPRAPARDEADGRCHRRRRLGLAAGHVLQPALARAPLPAGHAARAPRQPRQARLQGLEPRRHAGGHGERRARVAHYPATDGISSTELYAIVQEHRGAIARRRRPAARRARRWATARAALAAVHFPPAAGRRRGRPAPAGLRRAARPAADPARAAAPGATRPGAPRRSTRRGS